MSIETVDDIIERLADRMGVYGSHDENNDAACEQKPCRVCWTSELRDRFDAAYKTEAQLARGRYD